MTLKEGNKLWNVLTGKAYEVKKINKGWVLLQAENGLSQVLTGKMGLKFMYASEGVEEEPLNIIPSFPELGQNAGEAPRR